MESSASLFSWQGGYLHLGTAIALAGTIDYLDLRSEPEIYFNLPQSLPIHRSVPGNAGAKAGLNSNSLIESGLDVICREA
jgi:hypothetical protein